MPASNIEGYTPCNEHGTKVPCPKYGNNHIPIQNFYLQDVVKDAEGQLALKTVATIVKDDQDRFHDKCPMK